MSIVTISEIVLTSIVFSSGFYFFGLALATFINSFMKYHRQTNHMGSKGSGDGHAPAAPPNFIID